MLSTKLIEEIKAIILDGDMEENIQTIHELRRYKKEFGNVVGYNWYEYGNITPYYNQMAEVFIRSGNTPPEETDSMQKVYVKHIGKAIDEILEENENLKTE